MVAYWQSNRPKSGWTGFTDGWTENSRRWQWMFVFAQLVTTGVPTWRWHSILTAKWTRLNTCKFGHSSWNRWLKNCSFMEHQGSSETMFSGRPEIPVWWTPEFQLRKDFWEKQTPISIKTTILVEIFLYIFHMCRQKKRHMYENYDSCCFMTKTSGNLNTDVLGKTF